MMTIANKGGGVKKENRYVCLNLVAAVGGGGGSRNPLIADIIALIDPRTGTGVY